MLGMLWTLSAAFDTMIEALDIDMMRTMSAFLENAPTRHSSCRDYWRAAADRTGRDGVGARFGDWLPAGLPCRACS